MNTAFRHSFANRRSGLNSAPRLVGAWICDNPFQCFAGSFVVCLEVVLILIMAGIVHGLRDPSFERVQFTLLTAELLLFASAVGFLFLAIERYLNVTGKTQEYGLLRVLGAPSSYFLMILLYETIAIVVPGAVVGIVLTFGIRLGVDVVFANYLRMDVVVLCWPVAPGVAAIGSMIGGMIGARSAIRDGIVQALSYEK